MFRHCPQDLSATSSNLSGVKDPDVPSGPPEEMDISVILPVSMPLFHNKSNSLEPVVTWIISDLFKWITLAVLKPMGTKNEQF